MNKQRTDGGSFDPNEPFVYFIATNVANFATLDMHNRYQLVGVNEIKSNDHLLTLRAWCERGGKLFIDSGIFNLTMRHARKFNTTMNEALALAPEEIDGFDALFDNYCRTVTALGEYCWGYTELDQGGRENKIRMRAKLEGMGFAPMPIYHPLNDGPEYFDYLAERYDRFAFGNVVQAAPSIRVRLMATQWERKLQYPDVWIHYLGVTASALTLAFPANSCDSSTWQAANRWGVQHETAMTRVAGEMSQALTPRIGADNIGKQVEHSMLLGAVKSRLLMQVHRDAQDALYGGV